MELDALPVTLAQLLSTQILSMKPQGILEELIFSLRKTLVMPAVKSLVPAAVNVGKGSVPGNVGSTNKVTTSSEGPPVLNLYLRIMRWS